MNNTVKLLKEAGYIDDDYIQELDKLAGVLKTIGRKTKSGLQYMMDKNLLLNLTAASAVAGTIGSAFNSPLLNPILKRHAFKKMKEEYGDSLRNIEQGGKLVTDEQIEKAWDAGYHLAPRVMRNPMLANEITKTILRQNTIPANEMGALSSVEKNIAQAVAPSKTKLKVVDLRERSDNLHSQLNTLNNAIGGVPAATVTVPGFSEPQSTAQLGNHDD